MIKKGLTIISLLVLTLSFGILTFYFKNSTNKIHNDNTTNLTKNFNKKIFCIGDSLTIGRGVDISDSYPSQLQNKIIKNGYKYKVINAGKSGDTTFSTYNNIDWYISDGKKDDIVLLQLGENDSMQMIPAFDIYSNIEKIINHLKGKGFKVVLLGMRISESYGIEYSQKFKQIYYDLAQKNKDSIFFYEYFLDGVAAIPEYNLEDKVHPNEDGYNIISQKILDFLVSKKIIN